MESAEIAARARAALEILDKHGWTQGRLVSADGQRCLIGAWWRCEVAGVLIYADIGPLREEITRQYPGFIAVTDDVGCGDITRWNDAPDRTESEVRAILEKLAVKET